MLFTLFYYIVAIFLWLLFIPILLFKATNKKYRDSIPARFFLINNPKLPKDTIHFHACSLGEVRALKPIIKELNTKVAITTTTNTGFIEAKSITSNSRFLPYEIFLPFWYPKQKVLVVLEAELWYMLFLVAKKSAAKTILLNARISDNSYKNYKRFKFFYKKIFQNIDLVLAQSKKDKIRLIELGAKEVRVVGNIKVFQDIKLTKPYQKPKKPLLTIASSHEGEELLLLKHLKNLKDSYNIAIVPRHPERFKKVQQQLKDAGFEFNLFSKNRDFNHKITLVDAMGELINIYAISEVVLLCGSFVDNVGGHNPLEPAFFGCKVISGEYYFNQKALFEVVENIEICKSLNNLENHIKNAKPTTYEKDVDLDRIIQALTQQS